MLTQYRNHILPPYSRKDIIAIVGTLLVFVGLIVILALLRQQQDFRSKAQEKFTCSPAGQENKGIIAREKKMKDIEELKRINTDFLTAVGKYRENRSDESKQQLQSFAQMRKNYLVSVMRQSPEEALSIVMNDKNYPEIQDLTTNCSPTDATVEGMMEVSHLDDFDTQMGETFYILKTDTQEELNIHPVRDTVGLLSSMRVRINGYKLDKEVLVNGETQGAIEVINQPQAKNFIDRLFGAIVKKAEAVVSGSFGDQPTAVVLVNFRNASLNPGVTKDFANDIAHNRLAQTYLENSYGQARIMGGLADTYGPYTMNIDKPSSGCDGGAIKSAAFAASDAEVNFSKYSRILFVGPFGGCGWSGWAWIGKISVSTNDGNSSAGVGLVRDDTSAATAHFVYAHEMGHTLGVHHAGFRNCGSISLCTSNLEYGDRYNPMGQYIAGAGHMDAIMKSHIGWWNASSNVQTVTSTGTFTLEPYETVTTGLKALIIPRGTSDAFSVEFRTPTGVDATLNTGSSIGSTIFQGALIHNKVSAYQTSLIDVSPPTDSLTSVLLPGQTFTDTQYGISITVNSVTSSALSVTVNRDTVATPTQTTALSTPTPTVVLGSPTPTPTTGPADLINPTNSITSPLNGAIVPRRGSVTISATATDNIGVDHVTFTVGGNTSTDYTAPYSYAWSVPGKPNATYILTARAYDAAGNSGTNTITVTAR